METQFLSWREEFALGHEELDSEHQQLVEAISVINAAERVCQNTNQINALLEALKRQAGEHFQHENSIINKINSGPIPAGGDRKAVLQALLDAALSEHLVDHTRSFSRLSEIIRSFRDTPETDEQKISLALKSWFIDHAVNSDAHLKALFQAIPILLTNYRVL